MIDEPAILIRQYTDDDFAAACVLNGMGKNEPYAGAIFIRQAGVLYRSTFLCAVCDGQVCGYTIGAPVTGERGAAWVLRLGVLPSYRGRGVARTLMEALFVRVETAGISDLFLSVHPNNQPALSLYTSLRFIATETVSDYFGEGEDRLIMKKALNTAKTSPLSF
ncbi:MAG: GNAT family N-acetyltransferase [Methanomicrobiales archaeon]|jgi:ribosomal-protein-alanine N-acetyltransferase|nr:GNAT family N-acetyltransferase [Methanomicrobiales archaeon]